MKKLALSLCTMVSAVCAEQKPITMESLLRDMVDRDAVARFPQADFRLKQHSSYNRASKTPDEPEGWFANGDNNSSKRQTNLIRIEDKNGQKEYVLMDHEGAGAIVRSWMPFRSPPKNSQIRFYLDGSDTPALEGNVCTLLNGEGLIPYPFAHPSLRSAVSFFPIPYAKSCKVTMTGSPFYFQFTFREYEQGTKVKTFTLKDFEAAKGLIERTGKDLLNPEAEGAEKPLFIETTLGTQEEQSLKLPSGAAAVRELSVKLGDYSDPEVTRKVILKMEFDGKQTVWCPVGDFFGSGIGLNPYQGWYRTVVEDGTMSCRWVMPYKKSGAISIVNLGEKPVDVELKAKTGDWEWDKRSMYFYAGWRGQYPVATRPYSDWNYVTIKGKGVYVGDTLTIMNPVERWWGEGDEKIWVDGEDFPSIFGTGTEDYYAYSWGGVSTDFYEHPFHAQPRSHVYNKLNRKPKAQMNMRNTLGYSTETRSRSLDTMPFGSSLQLDMEVWSWTDCDMGYQVGAYWYGFADTSSNRKPEPVEVLNVPPLPDLDAAVVSKPAKRARKPTAKPSGVFKNAVEINARSVISKTGKIVLRPQNLKRFKGVWNKNNHVLFRDAQVGDVVELRIPASGPAAEKLVLYATRSYDFGILRFTVNGKSAGADVDLYAAKPVPSGPIVLGVFDPVDGAYVLRVEVAGKNPDSKGTFFGLDCVSVSPAAAAATTRPNVVLIFADDLGYGDLSCYGASKLKTPNIDKLAAEGRRFTDAHSASAVCTPSRYALMTGEYPCRKGLSRPVFLKTGLVIEPNRQTLADVMKGAGYATACIGKWHLGFGEKTPDWNGDLKPGPLELGFDYYYGVPVVNSHPPFVYVENHHVVGLLPDDPFVYGKKAKTKEVFEKMGINQIGGADAAHALYDDYQVGTTLAGKAVDWIKKKSDKPFFLYLATTNIHHPFTPAPRFQGTSDCGLYGDFVHELDWIVGEVVKMLEEQGVADNTLIIFTSDNGGMFNVTAQDAWDAGHHLNGELLGFKFGAWEGGHRVPFIARWPGKIEAGSVSRQLICNVDMVATMAALTGVEIKNGQARDSVNMLPALTGNPTESIRDHLVLAPNKPANLAVRKGKWMYIGAKGSGGFRGTKRGSHTFAGPAAITYAGYKNSDIENGKIKPDAPPAQLYDLEADLKQTTNLYNEYPEVVQEMAALLATYKPAKSATPKRTPKRKKKRKK